MEIAEIKGKELVKILATGKSSSYPQNATRGFIKGYTLLKKYGNLNELTKEWPGMKIKKLKIGENVGLFEMYVTGTWRIKFEITNENKIIIIDLWDDH